MAITKIPAAGFTGNNFRNIIINGDMSIAQRGTTVTGLQNSASYLIDRFSYRRSGTWTTATYTMSQSTDTPTGQGFANSAKIDVTASEVSPPSDVFSAFNTKIEGQMLQYLKKGTAHAQSVTMSFWVQSNKPGTYIVGINDVDNTRSISKSYTISAANTWEKKTITFEGDTTGALDNNNGESFDIYFYLAAGTNFTSGTLATSWESTTNANRAVGQVNLADSTSNEWYITGIQLEAASAPSDFEFLPYDVNLARCQRYFQNFGGTAPFERVSNGFVFSSTGAIFSIPRFSCPMRSAPSLSVSSVSDFLVGEPSGSPSSYVCTAIVINNPGLNSTSIEATVASGLTTNRPCVLNANSTYSARLNLDAEL